MSFSVQQKQRRRVANRSRWGTLGWNNWGIHSRRRFQKAQRESKTGRESLGVKKPRKRRITKRKRGSTCRALVIGTSEEQFHFKDTHRRWYSSDRLCKLHTVFPSVLGCGEQTALPGQPYPGNHAPSAALGMDLLLLLSKLLICRRIFEEAWVSSENINTVRLCLGAALRPSLSLSVSLMAGTSASAPEMLPRQKDGKDEERGRNADGSLAMGNLIKVLGKDLENCPHFFLDFENAQPTEAETAVWNQVSAVLEEAHGILAELQSYNGAGQEIREAIQNPGDLALQEKAWNAVCPLVAKLKRFYEFSLRLENALRSLLEALTSPPYAPMQHLEREQALAKQFAEILHFTLSFDELKMTNPAIQNDFSYYRRTISRNRLNNQQLDAENEVNNEMANRMSLFYAEATPMLKTLSNATTKFVSEVLKLMGSLVVCAQNKTLPIEDTTDCLSTMACVCRVMLETPEYRCRFTNTDTMLFCMRVMVGVIILYDHVHPVGAFAKTSKIDMKGCIKVLKEQPSNSVEGLLNALRYTTRHLNDDSTSKQIRALLQ
ncbi:hypothetical protein CCH79_00008523 [Gambusia affinis]|uniref:CYRIA/CYRIB Rac1 binding domain-containing protein n=2 Tax=Cyprinodontoidei TaxID=8087 RepID=A0A315UWA9_GAMAF|nr:hypothetical protein CCH79_00008523 [Gambusia affinis]